MTVNVDAQEETVEILYDRPDYGSEDVFILSKLIDPADNVGTVEMVYVSDGSVSSVTVDEENFHLIEGDRRVLKPHKCLIALSYSTFVQRRALLCGLHAFGVCNLKGPLLGRLCRIIRDGIEGFVVIYKYLVGCR